METRWWVMMLETRARRVFVLKGHPSLMSPSSFCRIPGGRPAPSSLRAAEGKGLSEASRLRSPVCRRWQLPVRVTWATWALGVLRGTHENTSFPCTGGLPFPLLPVLRGGHCHEEGRLPVLGLISPGGAGPEHPNPCFFPARTRAALPFLPKLLP